jgi:hypothetical protein
MLLKTTTTTKALYSNLCATRHRMNLNKSLTAVSLGSFGRCILITCNMYRPLWLVSVYRELKRLSRGTLCQTSLLSRATASNSSRENIGLSKRSADRALYRKTGYSSTTKDDYIVHHNSLSFTCFDQVFRLILHHSWILTNPELREI